MTLRLPRPTGLARWPRLAPCATPALALLLTGCGWLAPPVTIPPAEAPPAQPPVTWQAPLPPSTGMDSLRRWWQQFDDPVLMTLIDAGQAASPTIAAAASRIEQARAARVAADAALIPFVNANAGGQTGRGDLSIPRFTSGSALIQAGWEIDLFGAGRDNADAAQSRFVAAQAGWHDARISVAAELGSTYNALRGCEALVQQTTADVRSREETARITDLAVKAGLVAPSSGALARASAAQGRNLLEAQRTQCDLLIKALVALTALDEAALRQQLAPGRARLPVPATIAVNRVPGEALSQRPDLLAAEAQVVAAAADTARSQAQRYPRIAIAGSVGPGYLRIENTSVSGSLWAIGPLQISMPLFDGGTLQANVVAARARYDEALSVYRAAMRGAVREVETALITLDSSARRTADARAAVEGYEATVRAADARYRGGLGSLFDLEEARRSALVANSSLVELQRDQVAAWISLYRALGGGWTPADNADTPSLAAADQAVAKKEP